MMYNFTKTLDGINNTLCARALRAALRLEPSLSLNEGMASACQTRPQKGYSAKDQRMATVNLESKLQAVSYSFPYSV